jgi:hypothetical protein
MRIESSNMGIRPASIIATRSDVCLYVVVGQRGGAFPLSRTSESHSLRNLPSTSHMHPIRDKSPVLRARQAPPPGLVTDSPGTIQSHPRCL